jgi:carbonic anhydrase
MKSLFRLTLITGIALVVSQGALAQHWSYEGEGAPANWAKLDPKFVMCGIGKNQSPIDLAQFTEADLKPLKLNYKAAASDILNNGHTVQVNYAPGSTLVVDGHEFELKQFHFHAPSENTLNGKHFPLEGHLVHADKDGNLAVVAVMFSDGKANPLLSKLWEQMPAKKDDKNTLPAGLSVTGLLPASRDHYSFNGSLTTPPCSEGVRWLVIKQPATASKAQIERFTKTLGIENNRPVQPINAREVLR